MTPEELESQLQETAANMSATSATEGATEVQKVDNVVDKVVMETEGHNTAGGDSSQCNTSRRNSRTSIKSSGSSGKLDCTTVTEIVNEIEAPVKMCDASS